MRLPAYITTSWDDGHPMDLRVAALLAKHRISGTFYVPAAAETETMSAAQLRELSSEFEIGAHTLHHADLTGLTNSAAWQEIADSKAWVEHNTGVACMCFCPPGGRYGSQHQEMIRRAGYLGLRSVELLSLDFPRARAGVLVMPTTVQAFPHRFSTFAKNAIKRRALGNLWRYVIHGCTAEWPVMAESLLRHALLRGGVFHLWGHSWELQGTDQWQRLEHVLSLIGRLAPQGTALTNGELCRLSIRTPALRDQLQPPAKLATEGR